MTSGFCTIIILRISLLLSQDGSLFPGLHTLFFLGLALWVDGWSTSSNIFLGNTLWRESFWHVYTRECFSSALHLIDSFSGRRILRSYSTSQFWRSVCLFVTTLAIEKFVFYKSCFFKGEFFSLIILGILKFPRCVLVLAVLNFFCVGNSVALFFLMFVL